MLIAPALLSFAIVGASLAASPIRVAVLENPQCKPDHGRTIRVLFEDEGSTWRVLDSATAAMSAASRDDAWTIAFDGSSLGVVTSLPPTSTPDPPWTYPRDALNTAIPERPLPEIASPPGFFAGWCGEPEFRPLVLVSEPNVADPDYWKPFALSESILERVFPEFLAQLTEAEGCQSDDAVAGEPVVYGRADMRPRRSYRDRHGRILAAVQLDELRHGCDIADAEWTMHWFLIQDTVQFLGKALTLVDAGDYDADGESEVIFWFSGYNRDGYTLFYDGLQRRVDFLWNYH